MDLCFSAISAITLMSPLLLLDKTLPLRMMHVEQFDCMKTSLSQISGRVSVVYEGKDAIREKQVLALQHGLGMVALAI